MARRLDVVMSPVFTSGAARGGLCGNGGRLPDPGRKSNPFPAVVFRVACPVRHVRSTLPQHMPEEIFDVVDQRDEVVGQETRSRVHRLGLLHRAVHVLVFNRRGDVFLQLRSMRKDNWPGVWDSSASGHVDAGEDYDTCSVRELGEELGWAASTPPERLFKIAACADTGQEHVWVYHLVADGPFMLHPEEIDRGDWFRPEVVTAWVHRRPEDFASGFRLVWSLFLKR
jgi:isopentenyl-diphosphate delta-isomerase type 1